MAVSKLEIKNRIKSVGSIKKITKAMKLVASAKLSKQKHKMEENKVYATYLNEVLQSIVSDIKENEHPFLSRHDGKNLYLIITSDMGLCGAYNANVIRYARQLEGDAIVFGQRGVALKSSNLNILNIYANLNDDCYDELVIIGEELLEKYLNKEYASIHIVYTQFINTVTYEVHQRQLLPIEKLTNEWRSTKEIIFEPSQNDILNLLGPMYISSNLYSTYLESKTSEQASRRTAMESATDNADELQEKLELQYNQARQAAITQEISEIVAGADAL